MRKAHFSVTQNKSMLLVTIYSKSCRFNSLLTQCNFSIILNFTTAAARRLNVIKPWHDAEQYAKLVHTSRTATSMRCLLTSKC